VLAEIDVVMDETAQIDWLGVLILAVLGAGVTFIFTIERNVGQLPLYAAHSSMFVPNCKLVTTLVASVGEVTIPVPSKTFQLLVPEVG
jgi:hypothetical protein